MFVVNILLAVVAVFLGMKTYGVWFPEAETPGEDRSLQQSSAPPIRAVKSNRMPPESVFRVMVDKNLFSPQREWLELEEPATALEIPQPNTLAGQIVLYGVVLVDGYERALVKIPQPKPGERPSKWVKLGDTIADFKVAGIKKDKIVLAQGAKRFEVVLYDKDQPKLRAGRVPETEPTVVTTETKESVSMPKTPKTKKPPEGENGYTITPWGKVRRKIE